MSISNFKVRISPGDDIYFDWGAADDFAFSVKDILKEYISS